MSYFLRGALLSCASFFLLYVGLSIAVAGAWQVLGKRVAALRAASLYRIRLFPFAGAVGFLTLLILPSFVRLEPNRADETISFWGAALACGGIAVIAVGLFSVLSAWWNTHRFVASRSGGRRVQLQSGASLVDINAPGPILLVAGIHRPMLMISKQARELLDDRELQVAIRHELAHVRASDNLRKLALRFCRFPLLSGLERKWIEAAELAADDAAATDEASALDLASALLKMASRSCAVPIPEVTMSLASQDDNVLQTRVQRLLDLHPAAKPGSHRFWFALAAASVFTLLAIGYGPLLGHVHELTELLVR